MASNSSLDLTSLDFDTLKNNFTTYLKSQDVFKDYNFTGSNMNVLLDVLTYNTYLNSFYLNMVASEMFMDSAQKLESVISHAKELNYIPQSYNSSHSNVNIVFVTSGLDGQLSIPKGTIFTGSNPNGTFSFVTSSTETFTSSNGTYYANNVELYEGSYVTQSFVVDRSVDNQRFILNNSNIDLNSLTVVVTEDNGLTNTNFSQVSNLFDLNASSNVFFIQAAQKGLYEILFGDGTFGRIPQNGAVVTTNYRICEGPRADGVSSFVLSQSLDEINGGIVDVDSISVTSNSSTGSYGEDIETIRFRAPRWYSTQERAVSNDDYKSLILAKYGAYIQDINVFGGQEDYPYKHYGSVIVSVKPYGSTIAPDYLKNQIKNYLVDKSQMRTIIRDPDYLYLKVQSEIQYDKNKTKLYVNDLENLSLAAISSFSAEHLEKFNNDFRYSKFVAHIDNVDASVVSNDTKIWVVKKLYPLLNYTLKTEFSFNNSADIETPDPNIGYKPYTAFSDEPVVSSSAFTFIDTNGKTYPLSYIRDDNVGNLVVYTSINNIFTIVGNIGTIEYSTGNVKINNFATSYYNNNISIYMKPLNKDIVVNKDKILLIDPMDIKVTIVEARN